MKGYNGVRYVMNNSCECSSMIDLINDNEGFRENKLFNFFIYLSIF